MRILITATLATLLAISAQARTPDKVSPDDISPARIQNEALGQWPDPTPGVAATRPWLMQVTFFHTNGKPLLGGGDRFASREDCEIARRRLGSEAFEGTQRVSRKPNWHRRQLCLRPPLVTAVARFAFPPPQRAFGAAPPRLFLRRGVFSLFAPRASRGPVSCGTLLHYEIET
jgi:hypothetical protein